MILVGYTTTEGQTRRIARHVTDRLARAGHGVELLDLKDAGDLDPADFDRIVLGASVHAGHFQRALSEFAARHAAALNARPTLFMSVSLAAAGHEAEDWRALDRILADLADATGWTPGRTVQIAGAYRPEKYDVFRRFIMRRIIAKKDPDIDPDASHEYTDWPALDRLVDDWMSG